MIVFIILIAVFGFLHLLSRFTRRKYLKSNRAKGRIAMSVMLIFTALEHFLHPQGLIEMIPSFIPYPAATVYATGVLEVLGTIGLLIPITQRPAGLSLALFFMAVFPANLNAAVNDIQPPGAPEGNWYAWVRLIFQPVLVWWAWWCSQTEAK